MSIADKRSIATLFVCSMFGVKVRILTCGLNQEISGEASAGGAKAGYVQDAVVGGGFLQRQREKIGAHKVLPEIVVDGWVGEVDVGPDGETFSFWVGGALGVLEQFKAEDDGRFDLGLEGVEQADIDVNGGILCGGGSRDERRDGEDVNASRAETGAGCGADREEIGAGGLVGAAGVKRQSDNEKQYWHSG